jgi:hypothetical protein
MEKGPIPLNVHALIEPFVAIIVFASSWIFGFDGADDAQALTMIVGVVMLVSGLSTRWRYSLVDLIPLRTHFMTDLLLGAVLIAGPFVLGYSDVGGAARFCIIAGILEILTAFSTRWVPEEREVHSRHAPVRS